MGNEGLGQWFLEADGKRTGPYTLDQLRTLLAEGKIRGTDLASASRAGGFLHNVTDILEGRAQASRNAASELFDALQAARQRRTGSRLLGENNANWGRATPLLRVMPAQVWLMVGASLALGLGAWGISQLIQKLGKSSGDLRATPTNFLQQQQQQQVQQAIQQQQQPQNPQANPAAGAPSSFQFRGAQAIPAAAPAAPLNRAFPAKPVAPGIRREEPPRREEQPRNDDNGPDSVPNEDLDEAPANGQDAPNYRPDDMGGLQPPAGGAPATPDGGDRAQPPSQAQPPNGQPPENLPQDQ